MWVRVPCFPPLSRPLEVPPAEAGAPRRAALENSQPASFSLLIASESPNMAELATLDAQLAATRRRLADSAAEASQKLAASDAAEAEAARAECEQEAPYKTPSRARAATKALEVAQLHVSILHQKLEAESKLHGLQSPQRQATLAAYARAEQKLDTIEREADWVAAEEAEAEAAAAKASAQRAAAAKALRRAANVARQQAEVAAEAAAEAAAAAAAAEEAVEEAKKEAEARRAARDAEAARTAAAAAVPEGGGEAVVHAAASRMRAERAEAAAGVDSRRARSSELEGVESGRTGALESFERQEDLQLTFDRIMRDKAEAEKRLGKGRSRVWRRKA